jgi:RNAse (barnase) inhibitor barstar
MKHKRLLKPEAPWLHAMIGTPADVAELLADWSKAAGPHGVARIVRGQKATTRSDFFNELSAALQFSWYFGENWDAVDECLADLEWLAGEAYFIGIANSIHVLEEGPHEQLQHLLSVITRTGSAWSKPETGGWARPARPFHVVMQCTESEEKGLRVRLGAANKGFDTLE